MGIDRLPGTNCRMGGNLMARRAFYLSILLGIIVGCVMFGKAMHFDAGLQPGFGFLLSFLGFGAIGVGAVVGAGIGLVMAIAGAINSEKDIISRVANMTVIYALYGLAVGAFVCLMCFAIFVDICWKKQSS
jgi:hypothetical protein